MKLFFPFMLENEGEKKKPNFRFLASRFTQAEENFLFLRNCRWLLFELSGCSIREA